MTSIQQSLNSLIGATAGLATAGSYLYSQSDFKKGRIATKQGIKLTEAAEQFVADDLEEGLKVANEAVEATRRGYTIHPTEKSEEAYFSAISSKQKYEDALMDRQNEQIESQRNQKQSFKDRFDFLKSFSAKERGQFITAYNRHNKKGEID